MFASLVQLVDHEALGSCLFLHHLNVFLGTLEQAQTQSVGRSTFVSSIAQRHVQTRGGEAVLKGKADWTTDLEASRSSIPSVLLTRCVCSAEEAYESEDRQGRGKVVSWVGGWAGHHRLIKQFRACAGTFPSLRYWR